MRCRQRYFNIVILFIVSACSFFLAVKSTFALSVGCNDNLINLSLFIKPEKFDPKVMSFLDQDLLPTGLNQGEAGAFHQQLAQAVQSLLKHPVESKYFSPYFEFKIGSWDGFNKLLNRRPRLLVALFREYSRIRTRGSKLILSFDSFAPGSLQVMLLQSLHWARFVNFYEFLEFYFRVDSKRSRGDTAGPIEKSRPAVIYDSILYNYTDKTEFSKFNLGLRALLKDFEIWITPQTIIEQGERLRKRENELSNMYPAFQQELSDEEIREYFLLLEEVRTMRLEHSPSLPDHLLAADLRMAQMLFTTNADYFITPDFESLERLYWPAKPSGQYLEIGNTKFRVEEISIHPQGSEREFTKKVVNLSETLIKKDGVVFVVRKHWKDSVREEDKPSSTTPGRFIEQRRGRNDEARSPSSSEPQTSRPEK